MMSLIMSSDDIEHQVVGSVGAGVSWEAWRWVHASLRLSQLHRVVPLLGHTQQHRVLCPSEVSRVRGTDRVAYCCFVPFTLVA